MHSRPAWLFFSHSKGTVVLAMAFMPITMIRAWRLRLWLVPSALLDLLEDMSFKDDMLEGHVEV